MTLRLHGKGGFISHTVKMTDQDVQEKLLQLAATCLPGASHAERVVFLEEVFALYYRLRVLLDESI